MAFSRNATAELIKPLEGAIVRRYTAGAAIAAGELVSMSSDGFIDPSDSTSAKNPVLGVALQAAAAAGVRIAGQCNPFPAQLAFGDTGGWSFWCGGRSNGSIFSHV